MEATEPRPGFQIEPIEEILLEVGWEVMSQNGGVLKARDPESGISVAVVLEDDVVYFSVSLVTVERSKLTEETLFKMLDGNSPISTSSFQLYEMEGKKFVVALSNFCKLQDMGDEDRDDILSCINFLVADSFDARDMLSNLI